MSRYPTVLGAVWLAIGIADAHSNGTFAIGSVLLVVAAGFGVAACALLPKRYAAALPGPVLIGVGMVAVVVARPVEHTWFFLSGASRAVPSLVLVSTSVAVAALWWLGYRAYVLPLAVASFAFASIFIIKASPRPQIDVWYMLQGATDGLRHGADMYSQHWAGSPGITDQFPYLPMTAVLLAPFRWVFGDVRYGLLAAIVASAWLVSRLAPSLIGGGLGALLVLLPGLPLLIEGSWTEPLLLVCLTCAVLATVRERHGWAVVALGVAIATKQHVWLLVPLFVAWPAFGWRRAAESTAVGATLCLPWALANPGAFWSDAFSYNFHLAPRWDSLDLFSFALRTGWTPPFWLVGLVTVVAVAVAMRIASSASGVLVGSTFVLLVFNLANKQSFFNEWWLVGSLALVALAASPAAPLPATEPALPRSRIDLLNVA